MASVSVPTSQIKNDKQIRVLFMHGLEGGANTSRKFKILEKYYDVNMPNMSRIISGHIKLRSHSYMVWILVVLAVVAVSLIMWGILFVLLSEFNLFE